MLYSRLKDYMFRPVVAIIRSLSFDTLKIIYMCGGVFDEEISTSRPLFEALMLRYRHQTSRHTII